MEKILIMILMIGNSIQAMSPSLDFVRRFGSNSTIYNTPLYFGKGRSANEKKKTPRKYKKPNVKKINY